METNNVLSLTLIKKCSWHIIWWCTQYKNVVLCSLSKCMQHDTLLSWRILLP